jgi:hypothetical protein
MLLSPSRGGGRDGPGGPAYWLTVTSPLSGIPVPRRRQLAATVVLFAALFLAVGAVAMTGRAATVKVFGGIALVIAVLLGLIAWGVARSIRIDVADRRLDAAIEAAVSEHGMGCGCGHDHDADELHVSCGHDGAGTECERDCETCVLSAMRPSPHASRADRLAAQ